MRLSQQALCAHAASRVRAARPDLAACNPLATLDDLREIEASLRAGGGDEVLATVVLCRFDLASFTRAACAFACGVDPDRVAAWRRSFTRTVFLAGSPENLGERFAFAHVAEDRSAAWMQPGRAGETTGLRRLLKLFDCASEPTVGYPAVVEIPAPAAASVSATRAPVDRELHLAVAGVSLSDTLVHLHHLLAEAIFDGLIVPGDRLTLRQLPRLADATPFAALRADVDRAQPDRLRAYAGLTEET